MVHLDNSKFEKSNKALPTQNVIGFPISSLPFHAQIELIMHWAHLRVSKAVCVSNVHMLIEGHWDANFARVLAEADLLTPDGMPLVWVMSWLSGRTQERVAGMDILIALCTKAQKEGIKIFFLGSTPYILQCMQNRLKIEFPDLKIAGMESLPFRALTQAEDEAIIKQINQSEVGIVLVSLGCPKQEKWIYKHKDKVQATMIGLGGAFPVYAGVKKWAPKWVQIAGLEWCYRLIQEPSRLWKRYATTIPPFLWLVAKQIMNQPLGMMATKSPEKDQTAVFSK
jgi:N-acetylglucosaminyldiphosphoundecaprenol N-acetyl-beta-D-mannosaminyltransferase